MQVPLRKVGAQLRWSKGTCTAALRIANMEPKTLDPCFRRDDGALLLASPKTRGGQVSVRRLDCEREARERPMDGRRSDFRGHGGSSE